MKTVSFFCLVIFLSVSYAVPDGSALTCEQLEIPSTAHGEELTDDEFANHARYWDFELIQSDETTGFNYSSLEISFDSTTDENENIEGVVIQVVPAADPSEPVGAFTVLSEELTSKSCGESGEENTVVQVDGSSKNSFQATWVPLVEGDHEVYVSVLTRNATGYRNRFKVLEFPVSSRIVTTSSSQVADKSLTSLFASLMILCLNFN